MQVAVVTTTSTAIAQDPVVQTARWMKREIDERGQEYVRDRSWKLRIPGLASERLALRVPRQMKIESRDRITIRLVEEATEKWLLIELQNLVNTFLQDATEPVPEDLEAIAYDHL